MSVNEPTVACSDHEVELDRPDPDKQDIAGSGHALRSGKAAALGKAGQVWHLAGPQAVGLGQRGLPADGLEGLVQHADAVQPGRRIAAVKPKGASDERFCSAGKAFAAHWPGTG